MTDETALNTVVELGAASTKRVKICHSVVCEKDKDRLLLHEVAASDDIGLVRGLADHASKRRRRA
jgi:hypothetical protein